MPVNNGIIKKVVEAWPVLAAAGLLMVALLTAFATTYIEDVVKEDIDTMPKIIAMDKLIQANSVTALAVKGDTEDIKAQITALDAKLDRLIEIMLTDD